MPAASVSAALQGAPHAESPAATPPAGPGARSCPPSSQADGDAEVRGGPRPGRAAGPFPRDWNPAPVPSLRWCGVPGTVHSGLRAAWEDAVASPSRSAALMPWALGHCRDIDTQGAPCVSERPPPPASPWAHVHGDPGQTAPRGPSFVLTDLLSSAPAQWTSQAQDTWRLRDSGRTGLTRPRGQRGALPATSWDGGSPEACRPAGAGPPRPRAPSSCRSRSHSSRSRAWSWRRLCWASLAGFTVMCSTLVRPWS